MTGVIDKYFFKDLVELLAKYGINTTSKRVYDANDIDEFRNYAPDRSSITDGLMLSNNSSAKTLITYTRSPLVRDITSINSSKLISHQKVNNKLLYRPIFKGSFNYDINILSDSAEIIDLAELVLVSELLDIKSKSIKVVLKSNNEILIPELLVTTKYSDISEIGKLSKESGNIQVLRFQVMVTAPIVLPSFSTNKTTEFILTLNVGTLSTNIYEEIYRKNL